MEIKGKTLRNIFLGVMACIVLYWLLHETERVKSVWNVVKNVCSPFVVGAALAFIFNVPMRAVERYLSFVSKPGMRRALALIVTLLCIGLILTAVFNLLIPQLRETTMSLVDRIPNFFRRMGVTVEEFIAQHPYIQERLVENTDFEKIDISVFVSKIANFAGNGITTVFNGAVSAIGSVTGTVVDLVISMVFALYALGQKEVLARQGRKLLYSFFPEGACDEIIRILRMTNATFSNFISGQCLEAVILGGMFAVSMLIFKMPYVALVSVIITLTALVPLVGAFVGCVLGAFFILVSNPFQAFVFVIMFLVLQQIEGNLIYPKVVGTSIGLPGMWVLVAVTVGGELMGVGGMLLMIPLASVAYALLREICDRRLAKRGISPEKLMEQPFEFRAKRVKRKNKEKKIFLTFKKRK